ncbi:DASH complex subunit Ask1-domain-containing protein [Xylaria bambusicola]|uniref:DASH complex subunit Ask1-domain-containing protein n=1 Tax=Xylaria bambusicola TaxID=326684 RepID=UPI002008C34E|nr:DASH complex subunit Ask1-domain-containing protein [Xylaria bambusicola]KAI0520785.1 DASH complex subunit Ask1-domain-containing protein [Xylaria bambusicola]
MSRPGMASSSSSGRNLTLTEELERLEQSITLTLQEIDHNFSKAHRIVTTSILPVVEQYGEHSKNVWEASKFWKQFFEASANVSLSGYEELAGEAEETTIEEVTVDETTSDYDATQEDATEDSQYQDHEQRADEAIEDSMLGDATITGSTPRPPATKSIQAQFADFNSPYQDLRRELKSGAIFKGDLPTEDDEEGDGTMQLPPYHHGSTTRLPDMSMTPRSSSLLLDEPTARHPQPATQKSKDLLLHRVLDKNYRLQATPLKTIPLAGRTRGRSPQKKGIEEESEEDRARRALWAESPMSSPEIAAPKLRSDLYMSPLKTRQRSRDEGPRTPGISVQTPTTAKKRDIFAEVRSQEQGKGKGRADEITWESDEDDMDDDSVFGGMSPPKTIQFALPPSKLMQTPAREASRRIVDDILITAGAAPEESLEDSPTMVKVNHNILDDTF